MVSLHLPKPRMLFSIPRLAGITRRRSPSRAQRVAQFERLEERFVMTGSSPVLPQPAISPMEPSLASTVITPTRPQPYITTNVAKWTNSLGAPNQLSNVSKEFATVDQVFAQPFATLLPKSIASQVAIHPNLSFPTTEVSSITSDAPQIDEAPAVETTKKEFTVPTRGLSIIGLGGLLPKTVSKLGNVLVEPNTPKHLGFSFSATLFGTDKVGTDTTALLKVYANATALLNKLLDNDKTVTVTVFLGYHGQGSSLDYQAMTDADFELRAGEFVKFFQQIDIPASSKGVPRARFIISPSLEDIYANHAEFEQVSSRLAKLIPDEVLRNVEFLRTPSPSTSATAGHVSTSATTLSLTGKPAENTEPIERTIFLKHELHALPGSSNSSGYDFRSNDGFFVWADFDGDGNGKNDENTETAEATKNGDDTQNDLDDKLSLTDYRAKVKKGDHFWRPWMNVFPRVLDSSKNPKKDIAFHNTNKDLVGPPSSRIDDGKLFTRSEANILRKFLDIRPKLSQSSNNSHATVPRTFPEIDSPVTPDAVPAVPESNIEPPKYPLVIAAIERTTRPGRATNLHVSKYISFADGDRVTIAGIQQPLHGRVTRDPNHEGRLIYTSDFQFTGVDTFTYTVADQNGSSATGTATMHVNNQQPTPSNDTRKTRKNTPESIPVIQNDTDPDGDTLSVTRFTQPAHGKVTISPTDSNRLVVTPDRGFIGTLTFSYQVVDEFGMKAWATVTVHVLA